MAMLDDWSLFRREGVGRSFALLLNWKGKLEGFSCSGRSMVGATAFAWAELSDV